jgi:hypothetical protein
LNDTILSEKQTGNDIEREGSALIQSNIAAFAWREGGKPQKTELR